MLCKQSFTCHAPDMLYLSVRQVGRYELHLMLCKQSFTCHAPDMGKTEVSLGNSRRLTSVKRLCIEYEHSVVVFQNI